MARKAVRPVRLAFIGCGHICATHLRAMEMLPNFEIVAGCDINEDRLDWFNQETGCTNLYTDWRDMFAEMKDIDAVSVCTPNGVHMPSAIAALEAGCHVIVEKPMAMNPAECEAMIAAAKKAKKLLCVGFQYRYYSGTEFFMNAKNVGDIGDVMYVKVRAMRRRGVPNWGVFGQKELQGGGPMIDLGVHLIESAHYCMGSPKPVAASGNCWTFLGDKKSDIVCRWPNWDYKTYTVEDLAVGQIRFENGALMQIESSFCAHLECDVYDYEIMGTKGGYKFSTKTVFTDRGEYMINYTPGYAKDDSCLRPFAQKLQNFAEAIQLGTPLRAPGEAGLAVQQIIDGLYRSAAKNGKEVAIK